MITRPKTCLHFLIALGAIFLNLFHITPTDASFNEQLVIDAKAISLANAVSADPPDIMSIHYNPAGLSNLPDGSHFNIGFTAANVRKKSKFRTSPEYEPVPALENDPVSGTHGTSDSSRMYMPIYGDPVDFLLAPSLGLSNRKPGSKWTFAVGQYVPFWWGFKHDSSSDPARFGGKSMYWQHIVAAAPSVSYQLTPTLSFGLSVGLGQSAQGAEQDWRVINPLMSLFSMIGRATVGLFNIPVISDLTFPFPWFGGGLTDFDSIATLKYDMTDNFSPNHNLGMLWEPTPWFSFGLCYRSEISTELTGDYTINYSQEWQNFTDWFGRSPLLFVVSQIFQLPYRGVATQKGTVTKDVDFPQMIQGGIKLKPLRWLGLSFDLQWTEWSTIGDDRLEFDQDIQLLSFLRLLGYDGSTRAITIERNFKDTLNWCAGIEIDPFHWLTLRFGYEKRESSVDGNYYDLLYAVPDLDNYCGGFGIHFENGMNIDVGFSYLVDKGYEVKNNQSPNMNSTEFFYDAFYNPYAGLDYEQDTKAYIISLKLTGPTSVITHFFSSLF